MIVAAEFLERVIGISLIAWIAILVVIFLLALVEVTPTNEEIAP